jgi:hypothetical protein
MSQGVEEDDVAGPPDGVTVRIVEEWAAAPAESVTVTETLKVPFLVGAHASIGALFAAQPRGNPVYAYV